MGAVDTQAFLTMALGVFVIAVLALTVLWSVSIGPTRAVLAALCRVGWVSPLVLAFFPKTVSTPLPRDVALAPVHVFLDDSQSMQSGSPAPLKQAERMLAQLDEACLRLGCVPKVTRLSEQDEDTKFGYTPLAPALESWIYKLGTEPWVLISDGGDSRPTERWSSSLRGLGRGGVVYKGGEGGEQAGASSTAPREPHPRGLIMGFAPKLADNVWIKEVDAAPFSFEDKPLSIVVRLARGLDTETSRRIQLQVLAGDGALATVNAEFHGGELETTATAIVPPLPRGQHLLTIKALPTAGESALWDNVSHAQIEVLPNTVGVLHLLGSPSWDGRFLRRYLKSEPKYDLISFFILRDPWDSQQVSERELSLIPFPVERLFKEELPNFRVVVLQNFTLFQFLLPEYQQNLVKFVQDGGGLLFIGGPRALTSADLAGSPLRQILPFKVDEQEMDTSLLMPFDIDMAPTSQDASKGPAYDPNLAFSVEMAKPDESKRALANVYEDWEALAEPLSKWKSAKGLHHMERVTMRSDVVTPLLTAKVGNQEVPLAVASYPGKGRAIWIFTDAMWRLAMSMGEDTARETYNRFMHGAMTWLMRQDLRKPMTAKNFSLGGGRKAAGTWRVQLQGPAARYYQPSGEWRLTVCGRSIPEGRIVADRLSDESWELSGPLPVSLAGGERCTLQVEGQHAAFGSVKTAITAVFPEIYKDTEIDAAPHRLEELAHLTGAALVLPPTSAEKSLDTWIEQVAGKEGIALPSRFKTLRDFFWVLDQPWIWALLALMPLEVIIRRWRQLFAGSSRGPKEALSGR